MSDPFIELKDISKFFPGVVALDRMSLRIERGQVHGLIGENGAGKTTLIKVLTGVYKADRGEILINGKPVTLANPNEARGAGIGCVYQELNIVPDLTVTDNLFIGHHIKKGRLPFLDYKSMHERAREIMLSLGQDINPHMVCKTLGMGVQQTVEIGKSILFNSQLIIMDEPTSSLSESEVDQLMRIIRMLKEKGLAVLFVSHKLQEIFDICDVVTVMRDGQYIGTTPVRAVTRDQLITQMVGRGLSNLFPKEFTQRGEELLRAENLSSPGLFSGVSFTAYGGEILGFSGLVGAGRTEVLRSIFAADPGGSGRVYIRGQETRIACPEDAIRNGIAFLTENRKEQGLLPDDEIRNNLHLATIDKYKKGVFLDLKKREEIARDNVAALKIKTASLDIAASTLSGGNQQKVVIGKWINTDADIYFFDEPTRGIDVAAKVEVYHIMNELARRGKAVIMVSSELPEILGMSDRVIVMRKGAVMASIDRHSSHFNQESIMKAAWGGVLDGDD